MIDATNIVTSRWVTLSTASTTGLEPPQPCGVCSNGSAIVYHIGGPCPHLFPKRCDCRCHAIGHYTTYGACEEPLI